jgi:hypothetical protein
MMFARALAFLELRLRSWGDYGRSRSKSLIVMGKTN